ncbi:MAG: hypothetical protein K5905_24310, partial [Roseibium sp.]|nr:hypothetical protein [Roseibium sp.]
MRSAAENRLLIENELPPLPDGWRVERFRFLFSESKERNGATPIGDMLSVSEYRGVVPREYEHEEHRRSDQELENYRVVRPGQLAVNTMWLNHLGLGISDHLGHVSPAYAVYQPSKQLDGRFVHHLLRSQFYLKIYLRYLYGIRPNSFQIKSDDWKSIPVILPDLPTQKAIAAFLDRETARVDQLIEKKQRLVELLGERTRTKLSNLLRGQGLGYEVKPSGYEALGLIPSHWQATRLRYCLKLLYDGVHETPEYTDEGIPFLRVTDITGGREIDWDRVRRISPEAYRSITRRRKAQKGDLLLSKNGTVGIPRCVTWDEEFAFFVSLALIRPNKRISSQFL